MLNIDGVANITGSTTVGGTKHYSSSDAFVRANNTNFGNTKFDLVLSPKRVNSRDSYAVLYSPVELFGYAGINSVSFSEPPSFSYNTVTTTPAGVGDLINISGTNYCAIVVRFASE